MAIPTKVLPTKAHHRFGYEPSYLQPRWSPVARISVAALGGLALALSTRAPRKVRFALGYFGVASLIRAALNRDVTDLVGWITNPVLRIDQSIVIRATAPEVYNFLKDFANYPAFLSHVQSVELDQSGGLHWLLRGPGGVFLHWHSTVGHLSHDQSIGWRSQPGAVVRNEGLFELEPVGDGASTLVRAHFSYAPPVGALGYAAVQWLGFDPRRMVSHDLSRLKTLVEDRARNVRAIEAS